MREPIKILFISIIVILISSKNVGIAFLYAFCLICVLKKRREVIYLGITAIIFDLYHLLFVGITFISVLTSMLISEKFRPILNSVSFEARIYYLFLILVATETTSCLLTSLVGGNFDFSNHAFSTIRAVLLYSAFEILSEYKYAQR